MKDKVNFLWVINSQLQNLLEIQFHRRDMNKLAKDPVLSFAGMCQANHRIIKYFFVKQIQNMFLYIIAHL